VKRAQAGKSHPFYRAAKHSPGGAQESVSLDAKCGAAKYSRLVPE